MRFYDAACYAILFIPKVLQLTQYSDISFRCLLPLLRDGFGDFEVGRTDPGLVRSRQDLKPVAKAT